MRQRGLGILNTISELLDDPKLKQTGRLPEYSHSTSNNPDKILEDWMQPNQSVIEPVEYPLVNLSDFEGRGYVLGESDRAISNRMLEGIGNNPLAEPIELNTGSNFMFHNPQVWSSGGSVISRMMNQAKALKEQTGQNPIMLPRLLGPKGVDFDKNIATTMIRYNQANAPKSTLKEQDDIIRKHIPNWRSANDAQSMQAFYDAPAVTRKKLQIDLDKLKNMDGLSLGNARLAITNPEYIHAPNQTLPAVAEIDVGRGTSKNTNINYPVGFHGEGLGLLSTPLTARQLTEPAEGFFNKAGDKVGEKHVEYYIKQANPSGILTREKLNAMRDAGIKFKSGLLPTAATLGAAAMSLLGSEEAEASGLVSAVPAIARKLLDDPNAPKKNTPQGWANYLKNNGAKPNEIEKYNLDLIDSKRPLGKEEVSQYLLDNEYKFGRSLHTEQPNQTDVDVMREQNKDYFDEKMSTYGATTADVNEEIGFLLDEKQPNFRTDRSSGDITNYRNQVLTDPSGEQIDKYIGMNSQRSTQLSGELRELHTAIKNDSFILDNVDGNLVKVPMEEMKARQTQKQIEKARLELLRNQAENRLFVESSHFTEPNAIGHVRTTDRVNNFDPRTGKKTEYRLMEEVQSDWVQRAENPDYGVKDIEAMDNLYDAMYESKVNQYKAMANASPDEKEGIFKEYLAEQADISRRLDSMNRSKEGLALVPQPPVAKPHIPLINQTIIDAVDDNMDGVGIVTGDTQLAAKDQFQFINDISWKTVKSDGDAAEILFDFSGITNRQGDVGTVHQQLSMDIKKDLEAFRTMMPKGAADQIINDVKAAVERGDDNGVMSNFNTQVEGKKLRPYYNKTLRKHLEQIGKQYGVKVERRANTDEYRIDDLDDGDYAVVRDGDVIEEFNDIDEAKQYLSKQQMGADDHFYLPFTDKMKADVKKNGLKMFSAFGLTPVAIDAMRSNVNAEDERMRVVYDDTDTQREENRAAIEDTLARDAKTRKREELGDTLTGLLDAPRTALNLAGDAITGLVSDAATIPSLFVSAYEKATPTEADAGMGQRYGDKMKQLAELGMSLSPMGLMNLGKGDTRKEELIK